MAPSRLVPSSRAPFLVLLLILCACGESTAPARTAQDAAGAKPIASAPPAAATGPVTSLTRAQVKETISRGLGVFLQNVTLDDWPVMHDGKFHGFKIRAINPDWAVDLRPGDVVTRVNGIVPEHPEDADAALRSLEKAAALKVELEREGKRRTLELPIID